MCHLLSNTVKSNYRTAAEGKHVAAVSRRRRRTLQAGFFFKIHKMRIWYRDRAKKVGIGQKKVGAIRIIDKKENGKNKGISPIFILPQFQGKGIAQKAIRLCEEMHGNENWELDTILQESKNCHLYEKMGYRQTGKTKVINERLTLTFYEKKEADIA